MAGRPREFSNAAEKQKAYRERQKQAKAQAEALRNNTNEHKLSVLETSLANVQREYDQNQAAYSSIRGDEQYNQWLKKHNEIYQRWLVVHDEHYITKLQYLAEQHEGKAREWYECQLRVRANRR